MGIEGDTSSLTSLNLVFKKSVNAKRQVNIPRVGTFVEKAILTARGAVFGITKLITPNGMISKIATGRRRSAFCQFVFWILGQ